jgi:hypothetical protein
MLFDNKLQQDKSIHIYSRSHDDDHKKFVLNLSDPMSLSPARAVGGCPTTPFFLPGTEHGRLLIC